MSYFAHRYSNKGRVLGARVGDIIRKKKGEMVGDEAGEGIHQPMEVGFHYFTGQP